MKKYTWFISLIFFILFSSSAFAAEIQTVSFHKEKELNFPTLHSTDLNQRYLKTDAFPYPDAVRGIYVTGKSAGSSQFDSLIQLIESTDLNAMVIDVKDDHGNITFPVDSNSPFQNIAKNYIKDPYTMMETLSEKDIYPIARVVVFKDSVLAKNRPDLSFTENDQLWSNNRGESFVNPFEKEVWEYNVEIAKLAAKMGFREIQFDYVRFPEGFEKMDTKLNYSLGDYEELEMNQVKKRVEAVSDFVEYAKEKLKAYDVDVSVDIFGYAATIEEAPGIGQNFSRISENVDVISSMIYPSHWSRNFFGIPLPDREPYRLVDEYAKIENEILGKIENPPISRPWIQDFEAPWIYTKQEKVQSYGVKEVEAQIQALYDNGINEFLLWNAGNQYTKEVDYLLGNGSIKG